jgi:hypothetical protein
MNNLQKIINFFILNNYYLYIIMRIQGGRQQGDLFEGYDVDQPGF